MLQVYALTHMEWDCKNAECPFYGATPPLTFFSAVTLMMSADGGDTWTHARPPPNHLVAAQPFRWNKTLGRGQSSTNDNSTPRFQNGAKRHGLRCVLHPAPCQHLQVLGAKHVSNSG